MRNKKKNYPVFESLVRQDFGDFEPEYRFHPVRRWRFDYAFIDQKVAIEVEGLTKPREKSRHTTNSGYKEDCIKYNEATSLGWRVLRFTQDMLLKKATFDLLNKVLIKK